MYYVHILCVNFSTHQHKKCIAGLTTLNILIKLEGHTIISKNPRRPIIFYQGGRSSKGNSLNKIRIIAYNVYW